MAPNAGSEDELLLTRTFEAPRALVWRAWTEADRLARWWGPKGAAVTVHRLALAPGGMFLYSMRSPQGSMRSPQGSMRSPQGQDIFGRFVYREILAPERLVFASGFADSEGNLAPNPFAPNWPIELLNTLTLAERDGRTTLTLRGGPIDATDEQRRVYRAHRKDMERGFSGTFEVLAEFLANHR